MIKPHYLWFWQPPIDGSPGLLMIVDNHPGPEHPEVPFIADVLKDVLLEVESSMPTDIQLYTLSIYVRDVMDLWIRVEMNVLSRMFKLVSPGMMQAELAELWDQRWNEGATVVSVQ